MKKKLLETTHDEIFLNEMDFFKFVPLPSRAMATHSHFHEAIECIYVNCGSLTVSIDGEKSSIYPGDLAVFHSGAIHDIYTEDCLDNDYYVLKLMPQMLYGVSSKRKKDNFVMRFIVSSPELKRIWRRDEIKGTDIELGLNRLIESLDKKQKISEISKKISALMVFEGLYSSDPDTEVVVANTDDNLFFVTFYINEHYAEPISAEELAEKANMSLSSFSRKFKKATGQSFKDYLNTVRTDRAEKLLKNTELTVREVAIKVGYNNISHFIEVYKRYKGKTPLTERLCE